MTPLARTIITVGVILFTLGTLLWITTGSWEWFAGGGAIFFGTILAGGILSVEVKNSPSQSHINHPQTYQEPHHRHDPPTLHLQRPPHPIPPSPQPNPNPNPNLNPQPDDRDPFSS